MPTTAAALGQVLYVRQTTNTDFPPIPHQIPLTHTPHDAEQLVTESINYEPTELQNIFQCALRRVNR